MSASIAIAASANAMSAAALAEAEAAKKAACVAVEQQFNPDRASVYDRQQYASCIELLYPTEHAPLSSSDRICLLGAIVVALACTWYGAHKIGGDFGGGDVFDYFMGGVVGLCCGAGLLLAAAGLVAGLHAVFA